MKLTHAQAKVMFDKYTQDYELRGYERLVARIKSDPKRLEQALSNHMKLRVEVVADASVH